MPRLNVAISTHLFPSETTGLSGPWLAEQADALAAHCDVSVLAALRSCKHRDTVRPSGVRVAYRPTRVLPGTGRIALLAAAARYRLVAGRYFAMPVNRSDILHAHFGFPDAVIIASVARALRVPWVATLHGDDAFFLLHRSDALGRVMRGALENAAAVICVSEEMARSVRDALPRHPRVVTIANGYDDRLFTLGTAPRHGGILFVGTLTRVKNLDVLLEAYGLLGEDAPHLVIAGEGHLRQDLERLSKRLGLGERVSFIGEQGRAEIAALMKDSLALVIPSSSEGFGLVAAEALACGTPVVASEVGGLPGIVASADAGALVPAGSPRALAAAMREVLDRPHDPTRVAAASGAQPWSVRAREIAEVYEQLRQRD
jgi:glycosyltransferase involved in cell wall biosynthesis